MKNIYYTLLILMSLFTTFIISCDAHDKVNIEKDKDFVVSDNKQEVNKQEVNKQEVNKQEVNKQICEVYKRNNFRETFTCLYFEDVSFYDKYVEQINSVNDCNKFYSDLKNKNDTICEKYKCSKDELKDWCIDLFSFEENTINKKIDCIDKKCDRSKFISQCSDYEELCVGVVISQCLSKSGLDTNDFNIQACIVNNNDLIRKECTIDSCIKDEVKTCTESKCKLIPTKEYIKQCMEKEKDKCTTQSRVRFI